MTAQSRRESEKKFPGIPVCLFAVAALVSSPLALAKDDDEGEPVLLEIDSEDGQPLPGNKSAVES